MASGVRTNQSESSRANSSQTPSLEQGAVGDSRQNVTSQRRPPRLPKGKTFLKVEEDTFNPSNATRTLAESYKKNFNGSWPSWKKVPKGTRDGWFDVFKKSYSWSEEDNLQIRKLFEKKGSTSLSNALHKAKKAFYETNVKPNWIGQRHWDQLLTYWNSEDFKSKSETSSKNRLTGRDGLGPSLHTGGSIPVVEYKRRYVERNGKQPTASDLFLMIHKTKANKDWVDPKSKATWEKFKNIVKRRRLNDMPDTEDDREENEDAPSEEQEGEEEDSDEAFAAITSDLSNEVINEAWLEATGGARKGRVYGVGSASTTVLQECDDMSNIQPNSSSTQNATLEGLKEQYAAMKEQFVGMQEQMQAMQTAMEAMQQSQPQGSAGDGGSASNL